MMCYPTIEAGGFGNMPSSVRHQQSTQEEQEKGPTANLPPPALYATRDGKLIGMLTGAAPDCRPQPGGTSPTLGWSVIAVKQSGRGGGWSEEQHRSRTSNKKSSKSSSKRHFLRSCQKFKKTRKTFLQEQVIFEKLSYLISFPAIEDKVGEVNFDLTQSNQG